MLQVNRDYAPSPAAGFSAAGMAMTTKISKNSPATRPDSQTGHKICAGSNATGRWTVEI
jgi:hypothetical protein